jgi:hypothetical protein
MRFQMSAAILALLAGSVTAGVALAQTTPAPADAPAAVAPASPAPASPAMPATPKKTVGHHRTLQQHFNTANTSHDGHLTKDQATAAKWNWVTKNFAAMDSSKKGYVTMDDLHAFVAAQHASHKKPVPTNPATPPATNS